MGRSSSAVWLPPADSAVTFLPVFLKHAHPGPALIAIITRSDATVFNAFIGVTLTNVHMIN